MNYPFDEANRITGVNAQLPAATAYASSITYTPHGAIKQMSLGGALGIVQNTDFNPRLQPTSITAAHGAMSILSLGYT